MPHPRAQNKRSVYLPDAIRAEVAAMPGVPTGGTSAVTLADLVEQAMRAGLDANQTATLVAVHAPKLAARIAALDPATVRAVKGLLRDGCTLPYEDALSAERARFPGLWASDAHWHAVERFLTRKRD
jgi:enoyl-CoA hydratase/carnithine racemase